MLVLAAPASAATEYVSLGDSYAAGPLIPLQVPLFGCLKSNNNYANLAARDLGFALTDASCSGAETEDMTNPQGVDPDGPNPPQFNSLTAETDIVTIQIGGNDIGFSSIAEDCTSTSPEGTPCQDRYVHDGRDEISERIQAAAPLVAAVLQGIHAALAQCARAVRELRGDPPRHRPGLLAADADHRGDVPYVRAKQKELNAMLAAQAAANGAELIDWYTRQHRPRRLPAARDPLGRAGGPGERRSAGPPEPGRNAGRVGPPGGGAQPVGREPRTW